ncbi:hypothetical protein NUACC21_50480 [Scytonema sp. NUACC21]
MRKRVVFTNLKTRTYSSELDIKTTLTMCECVRGAIFSKILDPNNKRKQT